MYIISVFFISLPPSRSGMSPPSLACIWVPHLIPDENNAFLENGFDFRCFTICFIKTRGDSFGLDKSSPYNFISFSQLPIFSASQLLSLPPGWRRHLIEKIFTIGLDLNSTI